MNRREFGKTAGFIVAAAVVAPKILAEWDSTESHLEKNKKFYSEGIQPSLLPWNDDDWNKSTPEQRVAIQRMHDNMPSYEIFEKIARETPQQAPEYKRKDGSVRVSTFTDAFLKEGTIRKPFNHGDCRMFGKIGNHSEQEFERGLVGVDLSDISYVGMWRQAVLNKHTSEVKLFIATIPLEVAQEVNPGQTISFEKKIPIGTSDVEIAHMARESFSKLQELVVEYYNRES